MAHGGETLIGELSHKYQINWMSEDWYEADIDQYDIIIANDIFPDVDQRLELFTEKMLPKCRELRLLVTYYNEPKFYQTRRVDDAEIMTFLSWDGEITAMKLKKISDRINATEDDYNKLKNNTQSIYYNGRQVAYVVLQGDLS